MEPALLNKVDSSPISWGCAFVLSVGKSNCAWTLVCLVELDSGRTGLRVRFSRAVHSSWQASLHSDGEWEDPMFNLSGCQHPWELGVSSEYVTSFAVPSDESVSKQFPLIHHCFLLEAKDSPLYRKLLSKQWEVVSLLSLVAFELLLFIFKQSSLAAHFSPLPTIITFLLAFSEGFTCEGLP